MKSVSLHGPKGACIEGTIDDQGTVHLHGPGQTFHGHVAPDGHMTLQDSRGTFYRGTMEQSGHISLHGPGGLYLHGSAL